MKCQLLTLLYVLSGIISFLFGYKLSLDSIDSILKQNQQNCQTISLNLLQEEQMNFSSSFSQIHSKDSSISSLQRYFTNLKVSTNSNYYKIVKNNGKSVVDLVFNEYYHPSTISKAEFILTSLKSWIISKNNKTKIFCKEMYHTRTGSRTNQPAKCVAIITVQDGQHSPWITSNRHGFTAGLILFLSFPLLIYSCRKNKSIFK